MTQRRLAAAVGSTAAAAVAFTAFGAGPVWADTTPNPNPGPPIDMASAAPSPVDPPPTAGPAATRPPDVGDRRQLRNDTTVAPLERTRSAEFFVAAQERLPADVLAEVRQLDGVEAVETVDAARVTIDGYVASVLGVNPSTFRSYAPEPSADADDIWQGIAEGNLALSHDLGTDTGLEIDTDVTVEGRSGEVDKRVWTHASSGIAGIDVLASRGVARELGLPEGNGLVISAPDADLHELRDALADVLGADVGLQLLADEPGDLPTTAAGDPLEDAVVEAFIGTAEDQLGTPYVWGGEAPGGFDCSGLVQWAFAEVGVSVPRVAADQWSAAGQRIDYEDAERGDLLFWRSDPTAPNHISHVAIYLGNDRMLESPRTGSQVRYSDVRFGNMAGAVRVLG